MKNTIKIIFASASVVLLTACGGGGGGGDSDTTNNVLKKYEGAYYYCDRNEKSALTLTTNGSDSLNVTVVTDVYSADNCSGSVIGSYRLNTPAVVRYQRKTTATMPTVTLFPYSDTVDEVTVSFANASAQLTGSGVNGNCVNYSYGTTNGQSCFPLTFPSGLQTGAFYLTTDNQYLVQFSLTNGVLDFDGIYAKNQNFNYNMLTPD